MFSFGELSWPKDTDPRFEDEDDAIHAAVKASEESITNNAYGVWDDDSGELLHIAYLGRLYSAN